MAVTSEASAQWSGDLQTGSGSVNFDSSQIGNFPINWRARSAGGAEVTTPEELVAAAHASCFSMALSNELAQAGYIANNISVTASVTFVPGTGITGSHLNLNATIDGISAEQFKEISEAAKIGCPLSQALAGIDITLEATLS